MGKDVQHSVIYKSSILTTWRRVIHRPAARSSPLVPQPCPQILPLSSWLSKFTLSHFSLCPNVLPASLSHWWPCRSQESSGWGSLIVLSSKQPVGAICAHALCLPSCYDKEKVPVMCWGPFPSHLQDFVMTCALPNWQCLPSTASSPGTHEYILVSSSFETSSPDPTSPSRGHPIALLLFRANKF